MPILAVLIGYTLYNQLVPAPAWPYSLFPYVTLVWLVLGAAVVIFTPHLARRMGDGLIRTLGLSASGEGQPAGVSPLLTGVVEDPPPVG